ncbi:MAG: TIGR01244 family sulfur transferase [Aquisalinus sp.]|nr:TIGR01244 family sulfur transferase [Aquisalinus sp.]
MRQLTDSFFASGQISAGDIDMIAQEGFDHIVNNRPDHEEPGQPTHDELSAAAEAAGLTYIYLPVGPGGLAAEDLESFRTSASGKKKVLGFCKSGFRSVMIRAMALAQSGEDVDGLVLEASNAGFDISAQKTLLLSLKNGS